MDIEYQKFFDADGNEVEGIAKETFEKTTSDLNQQLSNLNEKLNNRENDISNIKKKYSEMTEEERAKMSQENQEIMKAKEALEARIEQIETERQDEYKGSAFSKYSIDDEEMFNKLNQNYNRISLTDEEKKLSLREQIELRTKYAASITGFEKPNVLNQVPTYGEQAKTTKSFSETENGIVMSAQLLGISVEQYKKLNNIK